MNLIYFNPNSVQSNLISFDLAHTVVRKQYTDTVTKNPHRIMNRRNLKLLCNKF